MTFYQPIFRILVIISAFIFHTVFFGISFNLSVSKHRKTGQRTHHYADAEIFIVHAELLYSGFFIGIAHKIHVTFKNFRIELKSVCNQFSVFIVFFVHHHMHERAVVNAVHPKRSDKITFHQPKGFGKKQRVGHLIVNFVHNFAPEFFRKEFVELLVGHRIFCPRRNIASRSRFWIPQTPEMFFSERHRGVEPNN